MEYTVYLIRKKRNNILSASLTR